MLDPQDAVLGAAFQVPVLDTARPGSFLLAAAHSVIGLPGDAVTLRSPAGDRRESRILFCSPDPAMCDLALLYVGEWLGEPVPCGKASPPEAVVIRGAPAGVVTDHANFEGRLVGSELRGGRPMLDVVLSQLSYVEPAAGRNPPLFPTRSPTYEALRGLSGGPVCTAAPDGAVCAVGIVLGRNDAGIANRLYGFPIEEAAAELAAHGVRLQVRRRPATPHSPGHLLTGLISRLTSTVGTEGGLWEAVSGLFYSGEPIDRVLAEMIRDPLGYGLTDEIQLARTEYLLSRLLLKRSGEAAALPLMRRAAARARQGGAHDHDALEALIGLRLLMEGEREHELRDHRFLIEAAFGRLSEVAAMPEDQRAYEIASAAGREAVIVCQERPPPWPRGDETESYFRMLFRTHAALLDGHETALRDKQEIVHIALSLMSALWRVSQDGTERREQIEHYLKMGRIAARQRSNAIFFCQMLLLDSIQSRDSGREARAFALACSTADALSKADLRLSHEGVRSILAYFASADPYLHRLVHAVHRFGIKKGVDIVRTTHVADSPRSEHNMEVGAKTAILLRDAYPDFMGVMSIEAALTDVLGE
jgi:hypothetical protein